VDNTRDYARVSHSRQWSNYNLTHSVTDRQTDGIMVPIADHSALSLRAERSAKRASVQFTTRKRS